MAEREGVMEKVFLFVDKDGFSKGFQVSIGTDDGGYRIAGPKYNGSSKSLIKHELDERDVAEIKKYLDKVAPLTAPKG